MIKKLSASSIALLLCLLPAALLASPAFAQIVNSPGVSYTYGTYTPVLTGCSTVPTFGTQALAGNWLKIGNVIIVNIAAQNTTGGTAGAGGALNISLPVPIRSNALSVRSVVGSAQDGLDEVIISAGLLASATTGVLFYTTVSGSKTNEAPFTCSQLAAAGRALTLQIMYPVD